MNNSTELRVMDFARLADMDMRIALVEITKGAPSVGMKFTSPDVAGLWQIVGFGTIPAEFVHTHPNSMNLGFINLDEGKELQAGINLVEAT
jgi:hypothetical protein